jgi:hypothetical protein
MGDSDRPTWFSFGTTVSFPSITPGSNPIMTSSTRPLRVTFAMTHPVQYYSPWFRFIAEKRPDIELTVIYATVPTPQQQGVGLA